MPLMTFKHIIHEYAPDWINVLSVNDSEIIVCTEGEKVFGKVPYKLSIREKSGKIEVSEVSPGTLLPPTCPERHINGDGTFCMGLNAGNNIDTEEKANQWWHWLKKFLQSQQWALKRGYWPRGHWLSHGSAATDHLKLEEIAEEIGWEEEIDKAIEDKEGWLAGDLPRYHKKNDMLVNQRLPCPRVCIKKKGKKNYPILRKDCRHKEQVFLLIKHERSRREQEKKFIDGYISDGFSCCGTMDDCPFSKI